MKQIDDVNPTLDEALKFQGTSDDRDGILFCFFKKKKKKLTYHSH